MSIHELRRELWVPAPVEDVFKYFSKAENLESITPPWLKFRILGTNPPEMQQGTFIAYALRVHGIPIRWRTLIAEWNPPFGFVDVQLSGPYKLWRHTHRFEPQDGGTLITDAVRYELPFSLIGDLVHWLQVKRDIATIFDYRAKCIQRIFSPTAVTAGS